MNWNVVSGCCAFFAVLWISALNADPLLVGDEARYRLGGHLEILTDTTHTMSFSEVSENRVDWRPTKADEPIPGLSAVVGWVRFQVEPSTDRRLLLVYQSTSVGFVDLYLLHLDGRLAHLSSGNRIPFAERPVAHRYPVFPLDIRQGETVWCYVQVRSQQGVVFPLAIWSESAFGAADREEQIIIGLFIGLFLVVILFNTLFYLATRDAAYLHYLLFVFCYFCFELAFRGLSGEYLWPRHTWLDEPIVVTAASLSIMMGIVFTRSFLQTRIWAPRMHRVLGILLYASIANTVATVLLPIAVMVQVTNGLLLIGAVIFIPNSIVVFRRGFRAARFYLPAWILLLTGAIIFGLLNFGLIPNTIFTFNALTFGASMQVILLSFAVVDRILLLRRAQEKMQHERLEDVEKRLYWDPLTELPNRNRLIADLQAGGLLTAIVVNIDHFKEINDYFGQTAGDYVIVELGNRIRSVVAAHGARVYRLHADEFVVLIEGSPPPESLVELGRALVADCQGRPYMYEKETLRLDVSVGIAVSDTRHLEKADMALSVSRSRKSFAIWRPELEVVKRYADNLHWLHIIRESLEQDRLIPFFQPILNNKNGAIEKFESLMRIRSANGSIIEPRAFLTIAKKSKIYPELSRVIVRKTARLMRETAGEVSINVSVEDIVHPDVLAEIDEAVSEGAIGRRIVFELLESEGIENYDEVSRFIERMKSRGCKIAIDDFGTGYSNFEHILRLRVDYLKLDASLIKSIDRNAGARCIVETIVSFTRKLGIQTIAEFVHNEPVQSIVKEIGIDYSQGYFIGEPRMDMRPG